MNHHLLSKQNYSRSGHVTIFCK